MAEERARDLRVLAVVAVLVALLVGGAWWFAERPVPGSSADGSTTGNVVTYDGRQYWVSGQLVAESSLGDVVARAVPYQGTTADLREVRGFPADQVLAAYIPAQRAGLTGLGWEFVAVDQALGTNPLADPSASAVLER